MHLRRKYPALLVSYFASAFAQQSCYWPDGSGVRGEQGVWVNCHPSQDSTCCRQGEMCLSNGLCYGSFIAAVGLSSSLAYFGPHTDSMRKTYRGACTVKDWSNTTACPTQWCNDGKKPFLRRQCKIPSIAAISQLMMTAANPFRQ